MFQNYGSLVQGNLSLTSDESYTLETHGKFWKFSKLSLIKYKQHFQLKLKENFKIIFYYWQIS